VKASRRPTLLMLTAIGLAASVVANGTAVVIAATTPAKPAAAAAAPPPTRLAVAIEGDIAAGDSAALDRKRTLDLREAAAQATEARLKALLATQEPAGGKPGEAGEQFDVLARIYQAMKPARAAAVFEQLALDVQMQVARRMRDRATAQILASMTPRGAAELSMALARKSALRAPAPGVAAIPPPALQPPGGAPPSAPKRPVAAAPVQKPQAPTPSAAAKI
jgi:flagellar motility protein MotE (MotC chaperone)